MRGLGRRTLGVLTAIGAGGAAAQTARPVRLIAPFAPGGTSDLVARALAGPFGAGMGAPVVVENRPGAGGALGTEATVRAAPDGTTFLVINSGHAVNATLMRPLPFDPVADLAWIGLIAGSPLILAVAAGSPLRAAGDLAARGTARTYASAGNGQTNHVAGEMLRLATGTELTHVPYRGGGPLLTDLVAGRVDFAFVTPASALGQVRAGALRALAVTGPARMAALPEVPTMTEAGFPSVTILDWWGLAAPARLPSALTTRAEEALSAALRAPDLVSRLAAQGVEVIAEGPAAFEARVRADVTRFADVIARAGIRAE